MSEMNPLSELNPQQKSQPQGPAPSQWRTGPSIWMSLDARFRLVLWIFVGMLVGALLGFGFVEIGFWVDTETGPYSNSPVRHSGRLWGLPLFEHYQLARLPAQVDQQERELRENWSTWLKLLLMSFGVLLGVIISISLCLRSQMTAFQAQVAAWEKAERKRKLTEEEA